MSMHHIALCTPCITLVNCGHLLHIWVDHAKLESKFQAEQVQGLFRDPQASSCDDANIVVIKTSSGALNQSSLSFILNLVLCSIMIVH
jgi:hypothetical protein